MTPKAALHSRANTRKICANARKRECGADSQHFAYVSRIRTLLTTFCRFFRATFARYSLSCVQVSVVENSCVPTPLVVSRIPVQNDRKVDKIIRKKVSRMHSLRRTRELYCEHNCEHCEYGAKKSSRAILTAIQAHIFRAFAREFRAASTR